MGNHFATIGNEESFPVVTPFPPTDPTDTTGCVAISRDFMGKIEFLPVRPNPTRHRHHTAFECPDNLNCRMVSFDEYGDLWDTACPTRSF